MSKNREYPERPFVGVGVVVLRGNEVLLIQRGKLPTKVNGASQEESNGLEKLLYRQFTGNYLKRPVSKLNNLLYLM